MNIAGQIFSLKTDQVLKYAPYALKLCLQKNQKQLKCLHKAQKIIVSKIYRNLNILCKLTKKQVKQLFKESKEFQAYQQVLADLYFDHKINNYVLINKQESNVKIETRALRKHSCINKSGAQAYYKAPKCISVDFRLEFTISNINKKKVMKPVVLIIYRLEDLTELKIYYSVEQFSNLRFQLAQSMKKVYGIELRTLF